MKPPIQQPLRALWAATLAFFLAGPAVTMAQGETLPRVATIDSIEFVLIPKGEFWYSVSVASPDQTPTNKPVVREVKIWMPDYYIARYEATALDFLRFLDTIGTNIPLPRVLDAEGRNCIPEKGEQGGYRLQEPYASEPGRPATGLSWLMADAYARGLGFRLPTDAEWQKAARGTRDRRYWPWGDEYPDDTFGHFMEPGRCRASAIDSYPKGRSPYGVFHLAGNVAEWVEDWVNHEHDMSLKDGQRYPGPPDKGLLSAGMSEPQRKQKGGRWSALPDAMGIARSPGFPPHYYNQANGVRFAVDARTMALWLAAGRAVPVESGKP